MALGVSRAVVFPNEIDRILRKPGGPVGVRIRRLCLDIAKEGERLARAELGNVSPFDAPRTGNYARRFAVRVEANANGYAFIVENRAKYAAVLEEGARAHMIRAKRTKLLRFRSRQTGQWVTKKAVYHPGLKKPFHILWRATESTVRKTIN